MSVVIAELYDALLQAGCSRELATAASELSLPTKDAAAKAHIHRDLVRAFEARGVNPSLADAAATEIVRRSAMRP